MTLSSDFFFNDCMRPHIQFSGDTLLELMRVSKTWHREILKRQKSAEEHLLTKLFETVFSCVLKNNIILNDYYFDFIEKKETHPIFQVNAALTLPQIDEKVHLTMLSLAKETNLFILQISEKDKQKEIKNEIFKELNKNRVPDHLIGYFKFALDFQKEKYQNFSFKNANQQYDVKAQALLNFIRNQSIAGTCFHWKVKTLKKFKYDQITKLSFKHVAEELRDKGFYHSAIHFVASRQFADDLGLPFMELLCRDATPLHCLSFIQIIKDPVLKGELLLKLMEDIQELDVSLIKNPEFLFDIVSVLPDETCQFNITGFSHVVFFLLKINYLEEWQFNHLLEKVSGSAVFFEKLIFRLSNAGLFEEALKLLGDIETNTHTKKNYYSKAVKSIVNKAIEKMDYTVALQAAQYILDKRIQRGTVADIKAKQSAACPN